MSRITFLDLPIKRMKKLSIILLLLIMMALILTDLAFPELVDDIAVLFIAPFSILFGWVIGLMDAKRKYDARDLDEEEKCLKFVEHIKRHIQRGDLGVPKDAKVICKFCEKSIDEIAVLPMIHERRDVR